MKETNKILLSKLFETLKPKYQVVEEVIINGFVDIPNNQTIILGECSFGFSGYIKNMRLGREINKFLKKNKFSTYIVMTKKRKDGGSIVFNIFNQEYIDLQNKIKNDEK